MDVIIIMLSLILFNPVFALYVWFRYIDKGGHSSGGSSFNDAQVSHAKNIALFHVMLPTLARTLDCGFRYTYFLAYDIGDAFYDTSKVCHGLSIQVPALIVAYKSYRASVKSWIGLRRTFSSF